MPARFATDRTRGPRRATRNSSGNLPATSRRSDAGRSCRSTVAGRAEHARIAPLFLLFDYTFRPPDISAVLDALAWARESGVVSGDEQMLDPEPVRVVRRLVSDALRLDRGAARRAARGHVHGAREPLAAPL